MQKDMHMQTADPKRMRCRDCLYRDRETMVLCGEKVLVGVMRDTCLVFDGKRGNWKPTSVVLDGGNCPFYELDDTAERKKK